MSVTSVFRFYGELTSSWGRRGGSGRSPALARRVPAPSTSIYLVTMSRNRCSVPCEVGGQIVSTHLYTGRACGVAGDAVVAIHERIVQRDQVRYDWVH
jgi:hypothetical protein